MRDTVKNEAKKIHLGLIKFLFVGGHVTKMPENRCVTLKQYSRYLTDVAGINSQDKFFGLVKTRIGDNQLRSGLISTFQTNAKNTLLTMLVFFENPNFKSASENTKSKLTDLVLFLRFLLAELIINDIEYNELISLLKSPQIV